MASRKSTDPERDSEVLLRAGHVPATELVAAIHAVNPTGLGLPALVERRRYALKSKLQSRLILDFFAELEFEDVANEPGVVGLRYRPQDRDACHTVVAELSEEARSKVQFHLDTRGANSSPLSSNSTSAARGSPRGMTSLLDKGRKALSEYDFDNAKVCFEEALEASEDDDAPALALLELLVDNLASWPEALALEDRLTAAQLTPAVRTLLALAAAHSGDAATCLRLAKDIESPRLAEALCVLASQALQRTDFAESTRLLAQARVLDGTSPQIVVVDAELSRLKAAQREPAEHELQALLLAGDEEKVEERARLLLERWPESTAARRVVREAEEKRRKAARARLEHQAQTAFEAEDDTTAVSLWGEALQLGATGIEKKLAAASARLSERARAFRLDAVVNALLSANTESSLGKYLELDAVDREQVRKLTGEEALGWLEVLGASGSREWVLDVAAAMTLRQLKERPKSAEEVLVLLRPHESRVRRLEAGRAVLAAAESELRETALRAARARLQSARAALSEGRWRAAVELAEELQSSVGKDISEEAKLIIGQALGHLESESRRVRFEGLLKGGNNLDALNVLRAAEAEESEDKEAWASQREQLSLRLREQLRVEVFKSQDGISACDALAGAGLIEVSHGLDEKGEFAYLATGLGRDLFVRKVDIRNQRIVEMVSMSTPENIDFPDVRLEGSRLWVTSDEGMALQLSTETWAVLRWHAARVEEAAAVDGAVVTPGGRFQWLCVRSKEHGEEVLRVIDLEKNKLQREMPKEGISLKLLSTSTGPRVWLCGYRRGGRVFALGGATEQTLPPGLQEVSVAPNGAGLFGVARPREDDDDETDEGLSVLRIKNGISEPDLIEELDSFNDGVLQVATALDEKVSFVIYADDADGGCYLVAYAAEGDSVKKRWQVRCPERGVLLQDIDARRVCLICALSSGLRCVVLTAEEPDLSDLLAQPRETHIPRLIQDGPVCSTGYDSALAQVAQLVQRAPLGPARQRALESVLAEHEDKPEALAFLARNLRSWSSPAEAAAVARVALERFPTHPVVALDVAEEAVEQQSWQMAIGALDRVREKELSSKRLAHWSHLRGLALYHLNRLEEARDAFAAAGTMEGTGCHVSGWTEWLGAMLGELPQSSAGRLLDLVRGADVALAAGQTRLALELLDVPLVWGCLDAQLAARLATAALGEPIGPRTRLIVAALMRQLDSRRTVTLPLGNFAWSKERLAALEERARSWLQLAGTGERAAVTLAQTLHRPSSST